MPVSAPALRLELNGREISVKGRMKLEKAPRNKSKNPEAKLHFTPG